MGGGREQCVAASPPGAKHPKHSPAGMERAPSSWSTPGSGQLRSPKVPGMPPSHYLVLWLWQCPTMRPHPKCLQETACDDEACAFCFLTFGDGMKQSDHHFLLRLKSPRVLQQPADTAPAGSSLPAASRCAVRHRIAVPPHGSS